MNGTGRPSRRASSTPSGMASPASASGSPAARTLRNFGTEAAAVVLLEPACPKRPLLVHGHPATLYIRRYQNRGGPVSMWQKRARQ